MLMLSFIKAILYFIRHPFSTLELTIVRRYADAQGHYIGELYKGKDRDAHMIGASCDNWPLNANTHALLDKPSLCWRYSFLDPLPGNTLRVGSFDPKDNARVQTYIAMHRFNRVNIVVLNRFVEHVLEGTNVKP